MNQPRADYDNPWQEVLERYFRECLALFLPQAHAEIDWSRAPVFLDKELRQVTPDAELGPRRVDKLAQVWRQDGAEAWVLVHVEVQSQEDAAFAERMYVYNYRLYDRFRRQVASPSTSPSINSGGASGQAWRCWATSERGGDRTALATSCGVAKLACASRQ